MSRTPLCLRTLVARDPRRNFKILAFILSCSFSFTCAQVLPSAQQAAPAPTAAVHAALPGPAARETDVSKEAIVFDKFYTRIRQESDGTGTRQTTARIRVLADAGVKQFAVLAFTYTASSQQLDIAYVRVVKPDGSVVTTPAYNIQDLPADVTREAPMYSDIHQKHVAVRGLGVGDTLEYQITLRTTTPDVPGQFWLEYSFEKNLVILDEQLDLDVPAAKQVTVVSADAQPTVNTQGERKLYHWSSSNLARPDPDAPPKSVKKWKPSVQATTFTSWEQVGAWYASLQKDSLAVTPAIVARAAELTKGLTSEEEKVRAIFNDVALHIHYVALEFGIGRYQPHAADDVLANQYGDCKDKHTLLAALLKAAGIEAWPVLISSGRYPDPDMPSPGQFDHVITVVPAGEKLLWMDSTEEVAPVGVIASSLRDKQALAVPVAKPAHLEHTPADLPFLGSTRFDANGEISEEGTFTGKITQNFHGDAEMVMRALLRSVPQSQWELFLQRMSNGMGFAGDVKDPQVSAIEQISQPLTFSYNYTREKMGEWDSHRISPPLPSFGWELGPGVKQIKPADDIELGSPGDEIHSATVRLPPGSLLYPPDPIDLTEDWAEYHAKYSFKDGSFTAERHLAIIKNKVPLADWDKYLDFRRAIYEDAVRMEEIYDLEEPPPQNHAATLNLRPGQIRVDSLGASSALREAIATLSADAPPTPDALSSVTASVDEEVQSVETKSTTLPEGDTQSLYVTEGLSTSWCIRGWAALVANDLKTAEPYLRAAWRLSQDPVSGYLLGRVLQAQGNKIAAAHQFELAISTSAHSPLTATTNFAEGISDRIEQSYRLLTGRELKATSLNHGAYNGSLQQELDLQSEIKGFLRTTKLTGTGLFAVAFEAGKPTKATFLGGDKGFATLIPAIQSHSFPNQLPTGSKARVLREVRFVCSPWAGCDAWMILSGSIEMPSRSGRVIVVAPPNSTKDQKAIRVEQLPVAVPPAQ